MAYKCYNVKVHEIVALLVNECHSITQVAISSCSILLINGIGLLIFACSNKTLGVVRYFILISLKI